MQVEQLDLLAAPLVFDFDVGVERDARVVAAALRGAHRPGVVDQHLPHDSRHQREEMSTIGQARFGIPHQPDEGLVHERRWL